MEIFIVLMLVGFCIYVLKDMYDDLKRMLDEHNKEEEHKK